MEKMIYEKDMMYEDMKNPMEEYKKIEREEMMNMPDMEMPDRDMPYAQMPYMHMPMITFPIMMPMMYMCSPNMYYPNMQYGACNKSGIKYAFDNLGIPYYAPYHNPYYGFRGNNYLRFGYGY